MVTSYPLYIARPQHFSRHFSRHFRCNRKSEFCNCESILFPSDIKWLYSSVFHGKISYVYYRIKGVFSKETVVLRR